MRSKDINKKDMVKVGGVVHKVIRINNGWITIVPVNKCSSVDEILNNELSVRASDIQMVL